MTDQRSDDIQSFLDSVLVSQSSGDQAWRNMGRWMGLYFLGVLNTGAEPDYALQITVACQESIFQLNRPSLPE